MRIWIMYSIHARKAERGVRKGKGRKEEEGERGGKDPPIKEKSIWDPFRRGIPIGKALSIWLHLFGW